MNGKKAMRVGVIGAGIISEIYLKNMIGRFSQLEVVAIAARHIESAQKRAAQFGIRACTVEELLADPQIELVVNLTPVGAHYALIRAALLAGKHVYTEKTLTDDVEKAKELLELARERGLYLGSAPDTFLGAAWQTARFAIDSGALGEIQSFAISANRDNDVVLSLFAFLREPGAGVVYDYGVYYLTALVSLLGPVERVGGIVTAPHRTHKNVMPSSPDYGKVMDTPNESQVSAVLRLRSGISGTLHIDSESNRIDEAYFAIYGERGILYLTNPNEFGGTVRLVPNSVLVRRRGEEESLINFSPYDDNARGLGPAEMAEAIRAGRKNRASKELAYHVEEVLTALLRGGEKGSFVDIASTCDLPESMQARTVEIERLERAGAAREDAAGARCPVQIALQVKSAVNMLSFYCRGLGLQRAVTLTCEELLEQLERSGHGDEQTLQRLRTLGDQPWADFIEAAPHQYIALFGAQGQTQSGDLPGARETVPIRLWVADIHAAWDAVTANGVKPDTEIAPGEGGALAFMLTDPDGNRLTFTERA